MVFFVDLRWESPYMCECFVLCTYVDRRAVTTTTTTTTTMIQQHCYTKHPVSERNVIFIVLTKPFGTSEHRC